MNVDFAVLGGSYAGLSAALQLARARRQVLVVDAGQRRNRFVDEAGGSSHGFLGQDGRAPAEIAAEAKRQLLRYPTVKWIDGMADQAERLPNGRFAFRVGDVALSAARLVLATGVRDELPPVAGLAQRWGRSVFHCPYCHGYELGSSPVAQQLGCVFADGPMGSFIQVGAMQETSVPNLFACGDAARGAGNVALAVGDGALAGVGAHRSTML
jgi:thioredoxin reductase